MPLLALLFVDVGPDSWVQPRGGDDAIIACKSSEHRAGIGHHQTSRRVFLIMVSFCNLVGRPAGASSWRLSGERSSRVDVLFLWVSSLCAAPSPLFPRGCMRVGHRAPARQPVRARHQRREKCRLVTFFSEVI